jgi:hypothetical protein
LACFFKGEPERVEKNGPMLGEGDQSIRLLCALLARGTPSKMSYSSLKQKPFVAVHKLLHWLAKMTVQHYFLGGGSDLPSAHQQKEMYDHAFTEISIS